MKLQSPSQYIACAQIWIEYVAKHFTVCAPMHDPNTIISGRGLSTPLTAEERGEHTTGQYHQEHEQR